MTQRHPLSWPTGWPRTASHQRADAAFRSNDRILTVAVAIDRLQCELDRLRARDYILSTNVELRLDGMPRSGQAEPSDPGAAIYFKLNGKDTVLACDKWKRVADNIAALAKHIEALRGMDRWGVGSIAQAFAGYQALPAPEQWWQVLGVGQHAPRAQIQEAYRELARAAHPDQGGSTAAMARLNAARDAALRNNAVAP